MSLKYQVYFLVADECMHELTRKEKKGWVVKLDLVKAYDWMDWDFLDFIMAKKGSGTKWRKWYLNAYP